MEFGKNVVQYLEKTSKFLQSIDKNVNKVYSITRRFLPLRARFYILDRSVVQNVQRSVWKARNPNHANA